MVVRVGKTACISTVGGTADNRAGRLAYLCQALRLPVYLELMLVDSNHLPEPESSEARHPLETPDPVAVLAAGAPLQATQIRYTPPTT